MPRPDQETRVTHVDPREIHQRIVDHGEAWADADAAANLLEETKKTLLAQIMMESIGGSSAAAAEKKATADQRYIDHINLMVEARRVANRAQVKYKTSLVWVELIRTRESTRRAEMNFSGVS